MGNSHAGKKVGLYLPYSEIPEFSRYAISESGQVLDKLRSCNIFPWKTKAGYYMFSMIRDDGKCCWMARHRLIGLVFKNPGVTDNLVINHINGIKGDDRITNIEWVTQKKNVEHAGKLGLTTKCIPISMRDIDSGEVLNFPSIVECARYLGKTKDFVNFRINKNDPNKVFPERKQYRKSDTNEEWLIPQYPELDAIHNGTCKSVTLRYFKTGKELTFPSLSELAHHLSISPSTVTSWLNKPSQTILPGLIQLKWTHDPTPWKEVKDPYTVLDKYRKRKSIKVVHEPTGKVVMYEDLKTCAKDRGLNKTTLCYRLNSCGSTVFSDKCRYGYYPY